MPIDFTKPTTADTYTTVPANIKDAINALGVGLDPSYAGTLTGTPNGAKRFNSTSGLIEQFNGTSWATWASAYAPLASPTLTGTPVAPTAAANTNSTQIATTAFYAGQAATAAPPSRKPKARPGMRAAANVSGRTIWFIRPGSSAVAATIASSSGVSGTLRTVTTGGADRLREAALRLREGK